MEELDSPLAFVDVETSGANPAGDRVIEIGILRVEGTKVTKTINTLVNPDVFIPEFIRNMTGINEEELSLAPHFSEIAQEVKESLEGAIFVAHNARFDYGFIKNELFRTNLPFRSRMLCTVRLSRMLYPHLPSHNLDSLITNLGLECPSRHRALSDAQVLKQFLDRINQEFDRETITKSIQYITRTIRTPHLLSKETIESLPDSPGVYIFYSKGVATKDSILYVGKSVNIYDRVRSHFSSAHKSDTDMKILSQVHHIETQETAGDLGASLKEVELIKSLKPILNRQSRLKQELIALLVGVNDQGYYQTNLQKVTGIDGENVNNLITLFPSLIQAKKRLSEIGDDYFLCPTLLGLEKNRPCFRTQLKKCFGACSGKESALAYNTRFIQAFADIRIPPWPFPGPIAVKELFEERQEVHFLNNWCYLGSVVNEADELPNPKNMKFDWDIYKVIKSYLNKSKNLRNVKSISFLDTTG